MKKLLLILLSGIPALHAQTPYRMAVIGLVHSHVWGHLSDIVKSHDVNLVGVAEPNRELLAEARKEGVAEPLLTTDYRRMIETAKPDLVWAFVENNRHLEIVEALAPRKIDIIFEKPLASTYKDALRIQQLAARYGIRVMCNYQMAWWPANYTAKKVSDSGALGPVYRLHGVVGHGGPGSDGIRNSVFFAWLTDPVQNGAGALMDFGCYNALWSLWYMGRPESVYARVDHLRPAVFPKVEDNADLVLNYRNGVGLFEGSWDLPRSYQDLEVFGTKGSVYMQNRSVEEQHGREKKSVEIAPLAPEDADPLKFMTSRMRANRPIEGLTALGINVQVVEIIEAARESVKTGGSVALTVRSTSIASAASMRWALCLLKTGNAYP